MPLSVKKYVIHSDYVRSRNDGDLHFITCSQLVRLYNVNPSSCIYCFYGQREREYRSGLYNNKDLIHLFPRYDGKYILKE